MSRVGVCGIQLARILDSISSLHFSLLVLEVSELERRFAENRGTPKKQFLDGMKAMDHSLCGLATRVHKGIGKRFTLILLGRNPMVIARPFAEFLEVGNIWLGERLVGDGRPDYYWTLWPARGCEVGEVDESVLDFVIL